VHTISRTLFGYMVELQLWFIRNRRMDISRADNIKLKYRSLPQKFCHDDYKLCSDTFDMMTISFASRFH